MISAYSSLVEFFGAIYLTMAVEVEFFSNIWTKSNNAWLLSMIKEDRVEESEDTPVSLKGMELLTATSTAMYLRLSALTNYRGGFMLSYAVAILLWIGNEPQPVPGKEIDVRMLIPFSMCVGLSVLLMLFSGFLLKKWKCVVVQVSLLVGIYLYLTYINIPEWMDNDFVYWMCKHHSLIAISLLIGPVVYHLFVNWMYHGVYQGYLKQEVKQEFRRYMSCCQELKKKEPKDLLQIDIDNSFERHIRQLASPSILKLLRSLFGHYCGKVSDVIVCGLKWITHRLEKKEKIIPINQYIQK